MKKLATITLLFVTIIGFSQDNENDQSDLIWKEEKNALNGNVQSLTYTHILHFGRDDSEEFGEYYEYNKLGFLTKRTKSNMYMGDNYVEDHFYYEESEDQCNIHYEIKGNDTTLTTQYSYDNIASTVEVRTINISGYGSLLIFQYNDAGQLIYKKHGRSDPWTEIRFKYDHDLLVKCQIRKGKRKNYISWEYNENHQIVKYTNIDTNWTTKRIVNKDENGNTISEEVLPGPHLDNCFIEHFTYESGQLKSILRTDLEGVPLKKFEFVRNEKGDPSEEFVTDYSKDYSLHFIYSYVYDDNDNWTKKVISYEDGEAYSTEKRVITYFP